MNYETQPIRAAEGQQVLPPIEPAPTAATTVLSTARLNSQLSLDGATDFRWRSCGHPKGWPHPCSPSYNPDAEKCPGTTYGTTRFDKFTFYDVVDADCLDPDINLDQETLDMVLTGSAWAVATELESAPWTGNPSLQSTATLLNPAGALSPSGALSLGLAAVSATALGLGSIIAPLTAIPALQPWLTNRNGGMFGPGGIRIITGPGLTGNNLLDTNVPGEATIYFLSSPVEYNLSTPELLLDQRGQRNLRHNTSGQEAIRRAKLRFNPSCVWAVRVCLVDETCCAPTEEPPRPETDSETKRTTPPSPKVVTGLPGVLKQADRAATKPAETATKTAPATQQAEPSTEPKADRSEHTDPAQHTIEEIKTIVGGNKSLAAEIRTAEQKNKNRTTLIEHLDQIIGATE